MPLLLSIETTSHSFSCALHKEGKLFASQEVSEIQSTASKLALTIEKLFVENGYKKNDLSGVVIAAGPGSYTGLRIGTATAKGICYALDVPLISVNSLYLLAYQASVKEGVLMREDDLLCPMLDARRMEVYCLLADKYLNIVSATEAKVINENSFEEYTNRGTIYYFGDGASKCISMITSSNARFVDNIFPSAVFLGELGYKKFLSGDFENLETFEPFYLKEFVVRKPNLSL